VRHLQVYQERDLSQVFLFITYLYCFYNQSLVKVIDVN